MPDSPNIKILVVDDLPEKLLVYRSILEHPSVELVLARSGADALRHLLHHDFAVILLDVNMPGMDGYETASIIRTRPRCALTPIIFITAHADELHALKGYSLGAVDYILSPVMPDVLRTKVRVFCDLYRLNQQVREQAAAQLAVARREQAHLAALLEKATDFVGRVDVQGRLVHVNRAGRRMLGYAEEDDGVEVAPAALAPVMNEPAQRAGLAVARSEGVWFGETILRARDGLDIPVAQVILAHKDVHGAVESFSVIARDIAQRKRTEAELAEHRARLEDLVRERTEELQTSHERLRLADRLASIGTLAAGLGHDMGNLLLPIRARLSSLEQMDLPPAAHDDIHAIKTAGEYLKRLSQGLRLFALDPIEAGSNENTTLSAWWTEVEPFLRNTLPKGVVIEAQLADGLPPLAIAPHSFTQAIYNLVQNAGDAMRERGSGHVRISATPAGGLSGAVAISVADDGPGMSEEVRQRCMEPFFTTRTRRISTGLGLALVRGVIGNVNGSIEIDSRLGEGTTFRLLVPAAAAAGAHGQTLAAVRCAAAYVALSDSRMRAYVGSLLRSLDIAVHSEPWSAATTAQLLVVDSINGCWSELEQFLQADARRHALVFGEATGTGHEQVTWLGERPTPLRIREALHRAISAENSSPTAITFQPDEVHA